MVVEDKRVPVTVLTGFLGSGKTTLLNHILTAPHGKKLSVIENEFGEVGIDDALLAKNAKVQSEEQIIEMMNGCICCTVRQDLVAVLTKLAKRTAEGELKLDGIIIETTGMADPSPVAQTFFVNKAVEAFARLDGIVTLVDAMHVEQHLDDEKPEGAENEAVEQVAFADRLLLNKVDLVPDEAGLARVEARLRAINQFAPIVRTVQSEVSVENVLDIKGFDLNRTLEMDPEFLNTDGEHVHDQSVTSLSIVETAAVDFELIQDWVHLLLQTQGANIFRMKGVLAIADVKQKYVFQSVHMVFRWSADERWAADEPQVTKLVLIGKDLDHAEVRRGFDACVRSPEALEKKAAKARHLQRIQCWAHDALPATIASDHKGLEVTAFEVRASKPECPFETRLRVMLSRPKEFILPTPLAEVRQPQVLALMQSWAAVLERSKVVHAWAVEALPPALSSHHVMVDEIAVEHVDESRRLETFIHVLATPPWSMKVMKGLDDVTQKNVVDVMAIAALCGSTGVASVS